MSKRVTLSDLELKALLKMIDGALKNTPGAWEYHTAFSVPALQALKNKLSSTPPLQKGRE